MELREAYSVLDISVGSSPERVRTAYLELVAVWHPDRFAHNADLQASASEKLKRINEAYETLLAASDVQEAEKPAVFPYCDADCRYLGEDARLRPLSLLERERRAVVEVTPQGIALATLTGAGQSEQFIAYPARNILWVRKGDRYWGNPLGSIPSNANYELADNQAILRVADPEGIVSGFTVRLKFQNAYFAELFLKRVTSAFCLVLPSKPTAKPKPTPDPKPKPAPAPAASTPT